MSKSIRRSLFAALAGFTVLLCLCYTGLALVIAYVTEDMLVQRLLEREAVAVGQRLRQHGELTPSGSDLITIYGSYLALPQAVREKMPASATRAEVFTTTGQHYHVLALDLVAAGQPQRSYLLADVAPVLVVSRLVPEVGGVVLGVALALIALALLLAYWLARRLVQPLQRLAQEASNARPAAPSISARATAPTRSVSWRVAWKPRSTTAIGVAARTRLRARRQPRTAHAADPDAQHPGAGRCAAP